MHTWNCHHSHIQYGRCLCYKICFISSKVLYLNIYIYIYIYIIFRSVVDVTRTVIVWLVGLIVTFSSDNQWENTLWYAILLEFIGFVILVIGNLVYNKIVILPIPSLYRENYSKIFLYFSIQKFLTLKSIYK
jgi:hypothetical protein